VGGLLALFLGASLITALEILDVMLHCACRPPADSAPGKRNRNRKSLPGATGTGNASNHVMFRPVASESIDEYIDMNCATTNHPASRPTETPSPAARAATLPTVKVNSMTFRGSGSKQAETDI